MSKKVKTSEAKNYESKKLRNVPDDENSMGKPFFKSLYSLWLISIVIFFVSLLIVQTDKQTNIWWQLIALSVISGFLFFIALIRQLDRNSRSESCSRFRYLSVATFIAFFVLLFNFSDVAAMLGFTNSSNIESTSQNKQVVPSSKPSPKSTYKPISSTLPKPVPKVSQPVNTNSSSSSQIDCTGPDGKVFKTSQKECDDFNKAWGNAPPPDPNEVIKCGIHTNCGGGYKEMRRADCEKILCCSLSSGNIMTSKKDCNDKQEQECIETSMDYGLSISDAIDVCD